MAIQVVKAVNPLGYGGVEEWKPINGFEKYHISNMGRVKSFYLCKEGFYLYQKLSTSGYLCVQLYKQGKKKLISIHRLVAENFIPNNDKTKTIVNHKNCIKTNNNINNLEWCNHKYNANHAKINNLLLKTTGHNHWTYIEPHRIKKGELNGRAILNEKDIVEIRSSKNSVTSLSKKYLVTKTSIRNVIKRKTWKHL